LPSPTLKSFVENNLPVASARIPEVGCGQGDLARELAASGHGVVAIDPDAPAGELFQAASLEAFAEDGRFDVVIASRALHHIPDLPGAPQARGQGALAS
jgi:2-polyprenyl-3-methyl-5-hydroxy-6-metoxy-1,4-benzoquinol methylase